MVSNNTCVLVLTLVGLRWWIFWQVQWYIQQWLDTVSQIIDMVAKIPFTRIMYNWDNRHDTVIRLACVTAPNLVWNQKIDVIWGESYVTAVLIDLTKTYTDMIRR